MSLSIEEDGMKWHCIYDLSQDHRRVKRIQKATLETEDMGLLPEIALFGSNEWWNAIKDGRIPKLELRRSGNGEKNIRNQTTSLCVQGKQGFHVLLLPNGGTAKLMSYKSR